MTVDANEVVSSLDILIGYLTCSSKTGSVVSGFFSFVIDQIHIREIWRKLQISHMMLLCDIFVVLSQSTQREREVINLGEGF